MTLRVPRVAHHLLWALVLTVFATKCPTPRPSRTMAVRVLPDHNVAVDAPARLSLGLLVLTLPT